MISFIVIGKNEGDRLHRSLKSIYDVIIADKVISYEVIYIDSKSSDGSIEYIRTHFEAVNVFSITGDCNAAIARNIGAKEAKGDILYFIDGDMQLLPGAVGSFLNSQQKLIYPFCTGRFDNYIHDSNWSFLRKTPGNYNANEKKEDMFRAVTGGLFLIDRSLWNKVGGMDTRFERSQDIALGLDISKLGVLQKKVPVVIVNHYMISYHDEQRIQKFKKQKVFNYRGLLLRRNLFNPHYYRYSVRMDYSAYALLFFLLLTFIFKYALLFYLFILSARVVFLKRKNTNIPLGSLFLNYFQRDISLYTSLFFFHPTEKRTKYERSSFHSPI